MKKIVLLFCFLIHTHAIRAMEGALYGSIIPAITAASYAMRNSEPRSKKIIECAMLVGGSIVAGSLTEVMGYGSPYASTIAYVGVGAGMATAWIIDKALQ